MCHRAYFGTNFWKSLRNDGRGRGVGEYGSKGGDMDKRKVIRISLCIVEILFVSTVTLNLYVTAVKEVLPTYFKM